jgi:hypothetical protein
MSDFQHCSFCNLGPESTSWRLPLSPLTFPLNYTVLLRALLSSIISTLQTFTTNHLPFTRYISNRHSLYLFLVSVLSSIRPMAAPVMGPFAAAHSLSLDSISCDQFTLLSMTQTWDNKVIDQRKLSHQVQLLPPLHWRRAKPHTTFGTLHDIPNEVLFTIFRHASLRALMNLRVTNSCAKYIVESWGPFRELIISAPGLVRAAVAIKASSFLTVPQLLAVTHCDRCELCGTLGSFVQLVKCMRCCFYCLSNDRRFHCIYGGFAIRHIPNPVAEDSTVTVLGLKILRKYVEQIPKVHTIKQECFWGSRQSHRKWALDYTTALQFANPAKPTYQLPSILMKRIVAGNERSCYYQMPQLIGQIYAEEGNNLHFMTAIYLPGLAKNTSGVRGIPDGGTLCKGCRFFWGLHSQGRHHLEHTMYSSSEIVPHLQKCPYAKLTWDLILKLITPSPVNGRILVPLAELLAKSKYFRLRRSVNFGEMPRQLELWFDIDYLVQVQQESKKPSTAYGDNLIGETQANWALARQAGPFDIHRFVGLWKAFKVVCEKRRMFFTELHDL